MYKNPIPRVDASKKYKIVFNFEEEVTKQEAIEGITELLKSKEKIPEEWLIEEK